MVVGGGSRTEDWWTEGWRTSVVRRDGSVDRRVENQRCSLRRLNLIEVFACGVSNQCAGDWVDWYWVLFGSWCCEARGSVSNLTLRHSSISSSVTGFSPATAPS